MEIQSDFKDLLELFNKNNVEYIIVGAHALAYHGIPRYTGDLDIYVKPDTDNARKIMISLTEFGFGSVGLSADDFTSTGQVVQLGVPPVRIDLITSITGVSWEEALSARESANIGDLSLFFLGREQLIANKKAVGRTKDLADLEAMGVK